MTPPLQNQVRRRRLAAGLSQSVLAERCGLTRQAVSAIEAGQDVPNTVVALRLGRALDCTVEELFRLAEAVPETLLPVRVRLARGPAAAGTPAQRDGGRLRRGRWPGSAGLAGRPVLAARGR